MTTVTETVTYDKIQEQAQSVVYYVLKDNILPEFRKAIKGREPIELRNRIDYPHIIVPYPRMSGELRSRLDYNYKKVPLIFEIDVHTTVDKQSSVLTGLVIKTLDENRSLMSDKALTKFKVIGITPDVEWDTTLGKKFYKTTIEISLEWNGS